MSDVKEPIAMTEVQKLADFVDRARFGDMSEMAVEQLKIRVLDTIGVAIGALGAAPIVAIRELTEELGVTSTIGAEIFATEHDYADRTVRLHFRECTIDGEPRPMLGQQIRWITRAELPSLEFPPADAELIEMLRSA